MVVGSRYQWLEADPDPYQFAADYLADVDSLHSGDALSLFDAVASGAPDGSLHLVLMSGMTDAAELLASRRDDFTRIVASVTMMSGAEVRRGHLIPTHTANNDFDFDAAAWLYAALQQARVPMTVLTRDAAYAAAMPRSFYDMLPDHAVSGRLAAVQHRAMDQFWQQCNLPKDHPARTLPWGPEGNPRTGTAVRDASRGAEREDRRVGLGCRGGRSSRRAGLPWGLRGASEPSVGRCCSCERDRLNRSSVRATRALRPGGARDPAG